MKYLFAVFVILFNMQFAVAVQINSCVDAKWVQFNEDGSKYCLHDGQQLEYCTGTFQWDNPHEVNSSTNLTEVGFNLVGLSTQQVASRAYLVYHTAKFEFKVFDSSCKEIGEIKLPR